MKLDSKYFDKIRVKPDEDRLLRKEERGCDWPDCDKPGKFPAPRGRESEGEYYHFCVDHVRQYNKSYNYFSGMADDDVRHYQKDSLTGHRPTWKMGVNRQAARCNCRHHVLQMRLIILVRPSGYSLGRRGRRQTGKGAIPNQS